MKIVCNNCNNARTLHFYMQDFAISIKQYSIYIFFFSSHLQFTCSNW